MKDQIPNSKVQISCGRVEKKDIRVPFEDSVFTMYKYLSFCVLLPAVLALPACSGQAPTEAGPSIADSTMIQLLIELHLTEARADVEREDQSTRRDSILLNYGVERHDFDAAMDYYSTHTDEFVRIYSEALDKLSDERYMPTD